MSANDSPVPFYEAMDAAERLRDLLSGHCSRIDIAGSLRRARAAAVGDIEIVAIGAMHPSLETDLFGDPLPAVNLLEQRTAQLLAGGTITYAPDYDTRKAPWGPKYKRFVYEDIPVDLFIVTPATWAVQFIIRTGPAAFSKAMVTPTTQGGLMPPYLEVRGGTLHHRGSGHEIIATVEERDVFRLYHLPDLEPTQRRWPLPALVMQGMYA